MALIDWVMVVVLLVSVLSAAKKGFFLEVFSLVGVIAGLLLASWNYQKLVPWLVGWVHSYPASEAISFIAIAIGVMIVAGLVGRLIRWSVHSVGLGWADRFIGAIFGFVKGCALITVAVLVVAAFVPQATWFRQSRLVPYFLAAAHQASVVTPSELGNRIRQGVTIIRNAQPPWLRPSAEFFPERLFRLCRHKPATCSSSPTGLVLNVVRTGTSEISAPQVCGEMDSFAAALAGEG